VRIPINVEDAQGINAQGLDIVLSYDAALIDPASVAVERTAVTSQVEFLSNTNKPGVVRIVSLGPVQLLGEGHLFDIVAQMKGGVSAGCGPVTLDLVTMYDAFARSLEVESSDTGQVCAGANCKQGDLNNDGTVDSADALIALNISVGIEEAQVCSLESSDLNGDGRIDSADAVMIFRLAGGKPLNPPQAGKEGIDPADLPLEEVLSKQAITVSVDTVEAAVGSTVQVPVQINDATGLCGLDLTVSYPAERAKLTFQRVTNGGLTEAFGVSVQSGIGYVKVSMGADQALGGKQEQTGSLVVLEFKVESAAEEGTTLPVAVNGVNLKGQYGESFDWFEEIGVQKGGIQITGLVQGSVVCNVIDSATQQPITNATLTITPSVLPPVTQNINGVYTFTPVPTGTYTIRAACNGYLDNSISVSVGQGTVSRTINMTQEAEGEGEGQSPQDRTLVMAIVGNGTVTPSQGSHTFEDGTVVALTATPATGWLFDHWEGPVANAQNASTTISLNADVTITAIFILGQGNVVCTVLDAVTQQPITNATLTISPSVLPPVTENINGVYTFTPVPIGAYTIEATCTGYLDDSISVSVGQGTISRTFSMTHEAEGEGEGQSEHTLTIVTEGSGAVDPPEGTHIVAHGAQVTLTATPADGWEFDKWEGGLSGSTSPAQITVNADVTVTAVFTEESKGFFLCAAGRASDAGKSGAADLAVVLAALFFLTVPLRNNRKTNLS